jgi:hypothetical protein
MRGADPLTSLHDNNPPSADVITIGPPALGHVSADSGHVPSQLSPTHRRRRLDEAMFLPRGALRDSITTRACLLTVQPEPDRADVISPMSQSLGANGFSGVLWRMHANGCWERVMGSRQDRRMNRSSKTTSAPPQAELGRREVIISQESDLNLQHTMPSAY